MNTINNDTLAENETCCMITHACGYPLKDGIIVVGVATIITSLIALIPSMMFLHFMSSWDGYNSHPVLAIDLLCALICTSTALYQIAISAIMLWFLREKKLVFLLTLWFGSNVVLLVIYFFIIIARSAICFIAREYVHGALTVFFGIVYEVIFIYFCMIVCSYESSLNPETIYF